MAGYTRQSTANIAAGLTIQSADLNAEFNQIQSAFDGATGHDHTGGSGLGPKISLTTSISGILPIANGGSGASAFSAGSVLFSDGSTITQDNINFYWDDTNNYLGIGTTSPVSNIHIHKASATAARLQITNSASGASASDGIIFQINSAGEAYVWNYENQHMFFGTNNTQRMMINAGGNVSIGNSNNTYKLDITGDLNISGAYRIAGTALAASHLSNGVTGSGAIMLAASPTTTGTLTAAAVSASGNATVGGTLGVTGAATLSSTLAVTSNATVGGTLTVTGATATGNLSVNGDAAVTGALTLGTDLAIAQGGTGASTAATAFANIAVNSSTLASPGHIKFQNGLIYQWGAAAFSAATSVAVTFSPAFATALFIVNVSPQADRRVWITAESTTGFTANVDSAYTGNVYWLAIGV